MSSEIQAAQGGALEALVQAGEEGRVRFLGLTGHHDPAILLDAMQRFPFDTVLVALNAADMHRLSFVSTVLAEAARCGMGVIGMKVYTQGTLLGREKLTADDAMGHVLSLSGVSTVVVGCSVYRLRNPDDGSGSHRGDGPYDTGRPQVYRLTHKPMTRSCIYVDVEKQMV